jgi:aspartate racemase
VTKHIGIVAVSPEGAALFYRQVFRQAARSLKPHDFPRVSLHNEPLALYIDAVRAQDWHAVGELLRRSADILARSGARFCLTPDNAVQHGVHLAEAGSPIPWLTMPELVARAIEGDGRKTVGLIGTKMVTTGSTYQTHLGLKGIRVLAPEADGVELLDRVIFSELIYGQVRPESRAAVLGLVDWFGKQGCEGVVLASSEAPLLISPDNCRLPIYDAADILAVGAVRLAMEG